MEQDPTARQRNSVLVHVTVMAGLVLVTHFLAVSQSLILKVSGALTSCLISQV